MKMLSKRPVVLYSSAHIARLETAGELPKRVELSSDRVGRGEGQVLDQLQGQE